MTDRTIAAVTTTIRGVPTLSRTLRSLKGAGFDRVCVFSDGGEPTIEPGDLPELEIVARPQRLGAWSNWLLSFRELVARHPDAARYLMAQDDTLYPRNLAAWLETNVDDAAPVRSLFCAKKYASQESVGWLDVRPQYHGYGFCGAQALVIPRAWADRLLSDPGILSHKENPPYKGVPASPFAGTGEHHVDGALGRFAWDAGFPVKVHCPSLVAHVGEVSSMYPGRGIGSGNRTEREFVGETCDLLRPLVACIMLSGGHPERQAMALDAIEDFRRQTHEDRILVVVDNHAVALTERFPGCLDGVRHTYVRTEPADLGTLRNRGLDAAREAGASLFMPWDDDDLRSPERIAAQLAATPFGSASVLRSHTVRSPGRADVVRTWTRTDPRLPGFPGLLLAPLYYPIRYREASRHEDTRFVNDLGRRTRVIGLDLDPALYVRRIHGRNVSPPEHFERLLEV